MIRNYEVTGPVFLKLGPNGHLLGNGELLGMPDECLFLLPGPERANGQHPPAPLATVLTAIGRKLEPGFDGPPCMACGGITVRTGTCFTCIGCGLAGGCG